MTPTPGLLAFSDDILGRSNAIHVLAVAAQMAGELDQARELMSERLALVRGAGNYLALAVEAANLSSVERQLGNLSRAEELAREATKTADRLGDEWSMPYNLNSMAAVAVERDDPERAARLLGAAQAEVTRQGAAWPPDELEHFKRTRSRLTEQPGHAKLARCWNEGASWPIATAISYALGPTPSVIGAPPLTPAEP